jgi:hypothetical protein
MTATRYPIRLGARSMPLLRLFGVRSQGDAWAELRPGADGAEELVARFGRFSFQTPVANIARWRIEGPWRWITAIGVRMSIRHRDVSFAGSPRGGVRVDVREPIRWLRFTVPAFYLGVEDLDGLAAALAERGIPGDDARTERLPEST